MITKELAEASAEMNEILKYLPIEYVEKIPLNFREFFHKIEAKNYISNITPYKKLNNQDLKPETKILLTIFYRNYWCTDAQKVQIDNILIENDKKYEKELLEKYNPNDLFKDNNKKDVIENIQIENKKLPIKYKEGFCQKIINFIKRFFRK